MLVPLLLHLLYHHCTALIFLIVTLLNNPLLFTITARKAAAYQFLPSFYDLLIYSSIHHLYLSSVQTMVASPFLVAPIRASGQCPGLLNGFKSISIARGAVRTSWQGVRPKPCSSMFTLARSSRSLRHRYVFQDTAR